MREQATRELAAFSVPSEPGNERQALVLLAEAVSASGLSATQLERLKTAVAEATMNAIEHGNHQRSDLPVELRVMEEEGAVVVSISDWGGATSGDQAPEEPDLDRKLAGLQTPRGWGLFLIRNMVDAADEVSEGERHTVRLTMRVVGSSESSRSQG